MEMLSKMVLLQAAETLTATAQDMPEEIRTSFWQMFNYGGWIMYVLLFLSIVAIYIFVERMIVLNKAAKDDKAFMSKIRGYVYDSNLDEARKLCRETNTPMSHMIDKGLSRLGRPLNDVKESVEATGKLEVSSLEKNVALVATISGVAPMLGFLGTVIGMVNAFYNMSMAGNNLDIALLSTGIYQAMVTTVGGLIVGVLAYLFYNILVERIDKVVFLLEAKSVEFLDLMYEPSN